MATVKLDHAVIAVSDWDRSNAFYRDVVGAEIVRGRNGWCYRFGDAQLNLHGPGAAGNPVARLPVQPGNSDICFEWSGTIAQALEHLDRHGTTGLLDPISLPSVNLDGASFICINEEALLVGDSVVDVATGRAAGVRVWAVSWGLGERAALASADYLCDTPQAVARLLGT